MSFRGDYNISPAISPDGKTLAYVARSGSATFRVTTLDLASGTIQTLTDTNDDESPSFAPNGRLLVYASRAGGRDVGAPITSGSGVSLNVFQYNDRTRPAAEATFDNPERWTSVFPVWRPEFAIQLLPTIPPKVNLTLSASPNSLWAIERALDLTGNWTNLITLLIGTNGSAQFQDTNSPYPSGFYRARLQ